MTGRNTPTGYSDAIALGAKPPQPNPLHHYLLIPQSATADPSDSGETTLVRCSLGKLLLLFGETTSARWLFREKMTSMRCSLEKSSLFSVGTSYGEMGEVSSRVTRLRKISLREICDALWGNVSRGNMPAGPSSRKQICGTRQDNGGGGLDQMR